VRRDGLAGGEREGASDYLITRDEPQHVNVTGDYAYMEVPATMTFSFRGKQVTQTGPLSTVALRKVGDKWRLSAWAWAQGASQVHAAQ